MMLTVGGVLSEFSIIKFIVVLMLRLFDVSHAQAVDRKVPVDRVTS